MACLNIKHANARVELTAVMHNSHSKLVQTGVALDDKQQQEQQQKLSDVVCIIPINEYAI